MKDIGTQGRVNYVNHILYHKCRAILSIFFIIFLKFLFNLLELFVHLLYVDDLVSSSALDGIVEYNLCHLCCCVFVN